MNKINLNVDLKGRFEEYFSNKKSNFLFDKYFEEDEKVMKDCEGNYSFDWKLG